VPNGHYIASSATGLGLLSPIHVLSIAIRAAAAVALTRLSSGI